MSYVSIAIPLGVPIPRPSNLGAKAKVRGKHLGRTRTPGAVVAKIETLAKTTDLSVRGIHQEIGADIGRGVVGDIVKRVRDSLAAH